MTHSLPPRPAPYRLHTARVLRVGEDACEVWCGGLTSTARFGPMFPTPRTERVSPGHLVALAVGPDGDEVVVWRWYDAVVLGTEDDRSVRLWEPAHGEVVARARPTYSAVEPGSRAFASAGLPGADWWVASGVDDEATDATAELDAVSAMYTDNHL